ncbi:MAG: phosphoribosyltransferase family protein [Pseudomonadota bacterium]
MSIAPPDKHFVDANDMLIDAFQLSVIIKESGFEPDFLVGLWRGGSAVGIAVQEGLQHFGVETDHIAVRTSYAGFDAYQKRRSDKKSAIRVHGLRYLLENVSSSQSLLIVDDVFSTGSSAQAVIDKLARKARRNLPRDIRIATIWYRPSEQTLRPPDFYVHETRDWMVLPYELSGLSPEDIRKHKPTLAAVLDEIPEHLPTPLPAKLQP